MKKLFFLFIFIFVSGLSFAQKVKVTGPAFMVNHNKLTFYLDSDTASLISVQKLEYEDITKLTGKRSDKWHKEPPYGPYYKDAYLHSGYDLGHLTPSNITSFDSLINYTSFSLFNQAPQLAAFNRGKWAQLESQVEDLIKKEKKNALVITGVIYKQVETEYLTGSRIKIPIYFYKVLVFLDKEARVWIGSNINGLINETDLPTLLKVATINGNKVDIEIIK